MKTLQELNDARFPIFLKSMAAQLDGVLIKDPGNDYH